MAYDPYARVFKPDMQADPSLPQWQPMGGNEEQNQQVGQATGSFVDMLKKRMAAGGVGKAGHGTMDAGAPMHGAGLAAGGGGGGMQSL